MIAGLILACDITGSPVLSCNALKQNRDFHSHIQIRIAALLAPGSLAAVAMTLFVKLNYTKLNLWQYLSKKYFPARVEDISFVFFCIF